MFLCDHCLIEFKEALWQQDQFFNKEPFPDSESNTNATATGLCVDLESAAIYCPNRYEVKFRTNH